MGMKNNGFSFRFDIKHSFSGGSYIDWGSTSEVYVKKDRIFYDEGTRMSGVVHIKGKDVLECRQKASEAIFDAFRNNGNP